MTSPEQIYVVGFPKSGNTWLTRLLADVLKSPVRSGAMRGSLEVASEINQQLSLPSDSAYEVMKIHFMPKYFFTEVDSSPRRIAYIYRDFRDVFVSAFFYFKFKGNETDAQMKDVSSLLSLLMSQGLGAFYRHYCIRRRMLAYARSFCQQGVKEEFGTWQEHICEWRQIHKQQPDIRFAFISYEELLHDTASALSQLLTELRLPQLSEDKLENSVNRQSFKNLKNHFHNLSDDANVPFGKEFNVKFLRKGVSGDWKRFISNKMGSIIDKYCGEMLYTLGYESNIHWYDDLPFSLEQLVLIK